MFTRHVTMKLKAHCLADFERILSHDIIPFIRRQKGFRHEDTFISPEISVAESNSYWDTEECAEAYKNGGFVDAVKALSALVVGTPKVQTFEISIATFNKITAGRDETNNISYLRRT